MRTRWPILFLMLASALLASLTPASRADEVAAVQEVILEPDSTWVFHLELGHRMYPGWADSLDVKIGEVFYLGDSEFHAAVDRFYPDFKILEGQRINTSLRLTNPAVMITVYQGEAAADTAWAFLNFPPHFSADSFFKFRLTGIDGYQEPEPEPSGSREGTAP